VPVGKVEIGVTEMGGGIATGRGTLTRRAGEIVSFKTRYIHRVHDHN
jgi:hypothetical protein